MAKIVIFDSGFGSLSIIKPIRKKTKSDIIYFADQKNFPYGKKTKSQLTGIINNSIYQLRKRFQPDLIIVGSNTPTLLIEGILKSDVIGVFPPLREASKISKTSSIAILTTELVTDSKELINYIMRHKFPKRFNFKIINASPLVELVESGKFIEDRKKCKKVIKLVLEDVFIKNNVDVATLSSTHLPFLLPILREQFPKIAFIDPADSIAEKIIKKIFRKNSKRNTLKVFTSLNPKLFEKHLCKIGIKNKVSFLSLD